jgi:hypothetical protein
VVLVAAQMAEINVSQFVTEDAVTAGIILLIVHHDAHFVPTVINTSRGKAAVRGVTGPLAHDG